MKPLLLAIALFVSGCSHDDPGDDTMATISSCPSKPNCVSSTDPDEAHRVAPLDVGGDKDAAFLRLRGVMDAMARTKLVGEEEDYLHYEVRSRIMRYVDDVEFGFDKERGVIDLRSASRVGYSDMGVNRKRVEEIRSRFEE
jgi:uncharacterized protein (DUF1499 family)